MRLLTETLDGRVLLEEDGKIIPSARGVQVKYKDGDLEDIKATREVIISAGAINSPQVLEPSGMGSAQLLRNKALE